MSRAATFKMNMIVVVTVLIAVGLGTWVHVVNDRDRNVTVTTNAQHQTTQLSYHGQAGQTALALLKQHATVRTKHYSFGDMVISIDGTPGDGPKYWTFYVNGKQAQVGAGTYTTKSTDIVTWKLQS